MRDRDATMLCFSVGFVIIDREQQNAPKHEARPVHSTPDKDARL